MDVAEWTDSGYLREYEIKISRGDFFADSKKEDRVWPVRWDDKKLVMERKHDLLAAGSPRGPVQFWYVVPEGMIKLTELPPFAGLIEMKMQEYGRHAYEKETVKAPRLHNTKPEASTYSHARGVCYYRYRNLLGHVMTLRTKAKEQAEQIRTLRAKKKAA